MHFTHLNLKNWRNFTSVDVQLTKRMFVVGPNAIGKSNLLDVFRFLRDLVAEGGGLAAAVKDRRGMARLRSLHSRKPDVEITVGVVDDDGGRWTYELSFTRKSNKDDVPVVTHERVVFSGSDGSNKREVLFTRPSADDRADPQLLTQTAIQQVSQTKKFRVLTEFFGSVSYLHVVPQLVRDEQRPAVNSTSGDPFGRDLLDRVRATAARSQKARLVRILEVLKLAVPNLEELKLVTDELSRPHLQAAFRHWRGPAAKQDEREFSDGTLRLIGLLWALQEPSGPLLLEEPELSLHAALVRQLAPFIARAQRRGKNARQAFISTHSNDLMNDPGIGPAEILLLTHAREGSKVVSGADDAEIRDALGAGLTAADAVMPRTAKEQIDLFAKADL